MKIDTYIYIYTSNERLLTIPQLNQPSVDKRGLTYVK